MIQPEKNKQDVYKRQVLVCVNNIEMPDAENMTVSVDAKGATENTNKDNLKKCCRLYTSWQGCFK